MVGILTGLSWMLEMSICLALADETRVKVMC